MVSWGWKGWGWLVWLGMGWMGGWDGGGGGWWGGCVERDLTVACSRCHRRSISSSVEISCKK